MRRPDLTIATEDHNTPTLDIDRPIADATSRTQIETLRANAREFGVRLHSLGDADQGIVHQVGPQLGLTMPGLTVVCGDSHTSTHGAFGALAFGIGTSEVEHVLATQTLPLAPFKTMAITVNGTLPAGTTSKDIILAIIAKIGTGGGQGYVLEYRGEAIRNLSMEARMTICNMSIEAGARAGMIAPDETTFEYLKGRPHAPEGADWDEAVEYWKTLRSDDDAQFDAEVVLEAADLEPFVTWGTNPGQGLPLSAAVPVPAEISDESERVAAERALEYMGLDAGTPLRDIKVDTVFIGSCTNGRIEDLRSVAKVVKGREKAQDVRVLVVPSSARVRLQAEAEGLDVIFKEFGAEWRNAGCSMCLGMNPDQLAPGSGRRPRRTATSRAGRARAVARTWSRRWSPPRRRSGARCPAWATWTCPRASTSPRSTARRSTAWAPPRWARTSSSTCRCPSRAERTADHGEVHHPHRGWRAAAAQQRRHRPDHPGRVPQAGHAHRIRGRAVRRLARRPVLRAQPGGLLRRLRAGGRPRLRHRLLA
nr:hypothetical protein GCM10025730_43800 [Promicromonospora thailandica]